MKKGPLAGVKIVSISVNLPGPVTVSSLRSLGASVVKIEPLSGDPLASVSGEYYLRLCQGQKVIRLDLKSEKGHATLRTHLKNADLLVTSSRPQSLRKLGLDWKGLHRKFPNLCVLNIVGFPSPNQDRVGHDLTYQAAAGYLTPPQMPLSCFADLAGAGEATTRAVTLLFEKAKWRRAGTAEVSLAESAERFAEPLKAGLTRRSGPLGGALPEYNLYRAKAGFVAVAALEPQFKGKLRAELGLPDAFTYRDLERVILTRRADEWEAWALEQDLPLSAVREV